jgi:hypothetical protein
VAQNSYRRPQRTQAKPKHAIASGTVRQDFLEPGDHIFSREILLHQLGTTSLPQSNYHGKSWDFHAGCQHVRRYTITNGILAASAIAVPLATMPARECRLVGISLQE